MSRVTCVLLITSLVPSSSVSAVMPHHSADFTSDAMLSISELLRVIQFFNSDGLHCMSGTEDGYAPGFNAENCSCSPHQSDYYPQNWAISLTELLRLIQFFNAGGYHFCPAMETEDNYCSGPAEEGEIEPGHIETILLPGNIPLEMIWLPKGSFMMGRYWGEQDSSITEDPQHRVTVQGFWMGRYELTKAQWLAVMGSTPWMNQRYVVDDLSSPVVYVSWNDAQAFLSNLNSQTGRKFRLPSEAEWEYACRAGTTTRFYWGDDDEEYTELSTHAWWHRNAWSVGETYAHEVGLKGPNPWGLYDMIGNVMEWCEDDSHWNYDGAPEKSVPWVDTPRRSTRILRGGRWDSTGAYCRAATRGLGYPGDPSPITGFRLVR